VIMVMVYATGHLSGAHINPAVNYLASATSTGTFPIRRGSRSKPCGQPATRSGSVSSGSSPSSTPSDTWGAKRGTQGSNLESPVLETGALAN
jgi:Major intrinsic protein